RFSRDWSSDVCSSDLVHYYFVNKYNHGPYAIEFVSGENWPVFRYADALLLLSECLVEQGLAEEAVSLVNQVRQRAGLPSLSSVRSEERRVGNECGARG